MRALLLALSLMTLSAPSLANSTGLASYYDRHMALQGNVAYGWSGNGKPSRMMESVVQLGVSEQAFFALRVDGSLQTWTYQPELAITLRRGVKRFAAGASGWFAIDAAGVLWHSAGGAAAKRIAQDVVDACIGDSADYYITQNGMLYAKGLAHRGQYGDGKLTATGEFVATASEVLTVKAHTGHAIHLRRDGTVMGTGGNRFGPLSSHGFGDKADRWGAIFQGAIAIATGSRHSLAIRADGSLWAWGEGFATAPTKLLDTVIDVAAGDTATIARTSDGTLWQWDAGAHQAPRCFNLP
jgi:alpha-tubulin suppressor-like RCC1 family protein